MPPAVLDIRSAEDSRDVVHRAVQSLVEGDLVAFPTETVYGIAASALNPPAVQKLATTKGRKPGHPLALAIKSADDALDYVPHLSRLGKRLTRRCWPGPVTLVFDVSDPDSLVHQLPEEVRKAVAPEGTVGLRVPAHEVILEVLRLMTGPLALSSANRTGQPDAKLASEVIETFGDEVPMVIDAGPCNFGQPSTVVRVNENGYQVLREGVVPAQTVARLASVLVLFICTGNTCRSPMAEVMGRKILADRLGCKEDQLSEKGVVVGSAGIAAMAGGRPAAEAVETMQAMGLKLDSHESQPLTEQLVRQADYLFTMTRAHREAILSQWPGAADRVKVLSGDGTDIADPIGGPRELYESCAKQIEAQLRSVLLKIEL